ncbi:MULTISPECIES: esterase/lipase family protein [Methylocaldum]|jgi:hypothetical protein|uniref:esterase/lipase family protein n=1 Tax=unclassified Methylocaldum TaxID=2622260 RepID=UPI000989EE0E|nr:alpha/beta fold hydrolase [Methylocaldum sp. 14B]
MSLTERIVPFTAGDGLALNLINVRSADRAPTREPVIVVHGAGVRANIFRAPGQPTVVDALVEAGYDVWLENWRASIDFPPNEWTLDHAALYDHPHAVRKILEETGQRKVKAIIHCQGSTTFTMSAIAGLVPEVTTIVSNAVSLHPVVPDWSEFKLNFAVPVVNALTPYVNPHWGVEAPTLIAKTITGLVKLVHHECDSTVCKMVSFTYGSGFPALWRHENLTDLVHEDWINQEFGNVPLRFFKQMARCVKKGNLVSVDGLPDLPSDFAASPPKTDARFVFFAGEKNRCFLPESQRKSWQYFDALRPGFHALHVLPEYSHLDVFMGKNAATDVFPLMIQELAK